MEKKDKPESGDRINGVNIRNCVWGYRCDKTWDTLLETPNECIKYCEDCDRGVHRCANEYELKDAIAKNYCVAFSEEEDGGGRTLVGAVDMLDISEILKRTS